MDLTYIALIVAFFFASLLLVHGCERLRGSS